MTIGDLITIGSKNIQGLIIGKVWAFNDSMITSEHHSMIAKDCNYRYYVFVDGKILGPGTLWAFGAKAA